MSPQLTIWSNAELTEDALQQLLSGTESHRLVLDGDRSANISAGGPSPLLEGAEIAFGQPDAEQIMSLPNLRWIHLTSAGYTRYDRDDLKEALRQRGAVLTNSSSVFDEPCAQHLLAFLLGYARQIPQSAAAQLVGRQWAYRELRPATRLLLPGQSVLIVGFGAIARRLAELLEPFNMEVIGVRQTVRGDEPIPTYSVDELDELLPDADHVVDILPANEKTAGFFNAEQIAKLKLGAIFYNIGRGTTVDQDALIRALESGRVGAAYLDVTDPEPLPTDHPLWRAPNCWITPHIGGGHAEEYMNLVDHFLRNLALFEAGEELVDRVV